MTKNKQAGQSLLEAIVAMGIVTLVLMGMVRAGIVGVRNSSSSESQALSARYGTDAAEWLRTEASVLGWSAFRTQFVNKDDYYCLPTSPLDVRSTIGGFTVTLGSPNVSSCGTIQSTGITRKLVVFAVDDPICGGAECVDISVDESWTEGNTLRNASYHAQFSPTINP